MKRCSDADCTVEGGRPIPDERGYMTPDGKWTCVECYERNEQRKQRAVAESKRWEPQGE